MSDPVLRNIVHGVPVFPDTMPAFDPSAAPESPIDLFVEWLRRAVEDGVHAPHAVNLATVEEDGQPDARVVIVKDVTAAGWQIASSSDSPKGRQMAAHPAAALTFFWPSAGRQIRVRGKISTGTTEENDADFQRRHPAARALVLAGSQSTALQSREDLDAAVEEHLRLIEGTDGPASPTWTLYTVAPDAVEFWQADQQQRHLRLLYTRYGNGWRREMLWP